MNDTALTSEGPFATALPGPGGSRRPGVLGVLRPPGDPARRADRGAGLGAGLLGLVLIMTGATNISPSPEIWTVIWIANGILVLLVVALVLTEAWLLLGARLRQQAGAGLQIRMVAMFAIAAAVPAAIVAVVATISLNQGLDQWFSERTKTMVESSRLVARSYMLEHAQVLRDDIIWVATRTGAGPSDLRDRSRQIPAHPDGARHYPLAAVHLADQRRRRHADAGADQRPRRTAANSRRLTQGVEEGCRPRSPPARPT